MTTTIAATDNENETTYVLQRLRSQPEVINEQRIIRQHPRHVTHQPDDEALLPVENIRDDNRQRRIPPRIVREQPRPLDEPEPLQVLLIRDEVLLLRILQVVLQQRP